MTYSLITAEHDLDPRWEVLAEGRGRTDRARRLAADLLLAAHERMLCAAARHTTDGYLTRAQALDACSGDRWRLDALTRPALGRPPFLHQQGDKCGERNCIDASGPWVDGFAYRLCSYLKRNPSRKEAELQRRKKAELGDPRLRKEVYERDGYCCRYCRSGPMKPIGMGNAKDKRRAPTLDHIDPGKADGAANLALACKRCNRDKSADKIALTLDEAGMVLLPEPTDPQREWWADRGEQQFDRPSPGDRSPADDLPHGWDDTPDTPEDTPPSTAPDTPEDTERDVTPPVSGVVSEGVSGDGVARPESPGDVHEHPPETTSARSGSDRVGFPTVGVSPGRQNFSPDPYQLPAREPDAPDIYTGRSRADPDPTPRTTW